MPISKKALCFLGVTLLAACYIFFSLFTNIVTATQSVNLLLEKKFDNSSFVIPDEYFKVECRFKNQSIAAATLESELKVEGRFNNSNLLIAEKILSASPDFVSVNSNVLAQNINGILDAGRSEMTAEGNAGENDLASLIVIGDNRDSFQTLTSGKLYVAKLQNDTYVPGYLRGIDFASYSGLHLDRGEGEEELPASVEYNDGELLMPAFGTLLGASYADAMHSESETSLDMSDIDQTADKLPSRGIFKRFSNFKDLNIIASNELEPFDIDCAFLPEKSGPKEFNKFHVVGPKDSLVSIASEYQVTVSELMAANNLQTTSLTPGSTLLVPEKRPAGAETTLAQSGGEKQAGGEGAGVESHQKSVVQADAALKRMLWPSPVSRRITSTFGIRVHPVYRVKKFHNGIDIGARYGSAIKASADGVVVYSGWKSYYGRTVIIKHSGDLYTLYAHCSKLDVQKGERVSRGTLIARVGSTGLSTGPHIHFSIQKSGRFINPMKYF